MWIKSQKKELQKFCGNAEEKSVKQALSVITRNKKQRKKVFQFAGNFNSGKVVCIKVYASLKVYWIHFFSASVAQNLQNLKPFSHLKCRKKLQKCYRGL